MTTWDDVARACLALPATTEQSSYGGTRSWRVRDKAFVWERPLRRKDVAELGDAAPAGPVLGAYVPDEGAKAALIAEEPDVYFTTSHFTGYPGGALPPGPARRAGSDRARRGGVGVPGTEAAARRAPARAAVVRTRAGSARSPRPA